jgi:hypothetical protein
MDALLVTIPKAPKVPHDFQALLCFQVPQTRVQIRRCAETAARLDAVDLEGTTQADQLG